MGEKSGVTCYLQQSESNTLSKPFSYEDMNSELLDSEAYEPYARVFQSSVFVNSILFILSIYHAAAPMKDCLKVFAWI